MLNQSPYFFLGGGIVSPIFPIMFIMFFFLKKLLTNFLVRAISFALLFFSVCMFLRLDYSPWEWVGRSDYKLTRLILQILFFIEFVLQTYFCRVTL